MAWLRSTRRGGACVWCASWRPEKVVSGSPQSLASQVAKTRAAGLAPSHQEIGCLRGLGLRVGTARIRPAVEERDFGIRESLVEAGRVVQHQDLLRVPPGKPPQFSGSLFHGAVGDVHHFAPLRCRRSQAGHRVVEGARALVVQPDADGLNECSSMFPQIIVSAAHRPDRANLETICADEQVCARGALAVRALTFGETGTSRISICML